MATLSPWIAGARLRTLPAAITPVVVGTAAAAANRDVEDGTKGAQLGLALLTLIVACLLHISSSWAEGSLPGSGLRVAARCCVAVAVFVGFALVALSQAWLLLPVGAALVLGAWWYHARAGGDPELAEVHVFVAYGLAATLATQYVQLLTITAVGLLGAVAVGALASTIVLARHLRDQSADRSAGHRTLPVRLGDERARLLYLGLIGVAVVATLLMAIWRPWAPLGLLGLVIAWPGIDAVRDGATGRALEPAVGLAGFAQLMWAVWLFAPLAR